MKSKKRESRTGGSAGTAVATASKKPASGAWRYAMAAAAALAALFWAYSPALYGPFLFDDTTLPFALPGFNQPLIVWVRGVRPVLYFTYWVNAQASGENPFSYHVVNVLIHWVTAGMVFLIVRRLLEWAGADSARRDLIGAFAAVVFLLHPVQSEAVGYLAGRSESLSVMFAFAAFALFLYRSPQGVSWIRVAAVLLLFGAAILSKEQVVALPALFLLTDYWWSPGFSFQGIRRNWKLYLPMALGGVAAVPVLWKTLAGAQTAGFAMKDLTWYQYFFTQCRALFVYIGMFLLPARLTVDWDFPISKTVLDHGAIVGLIALVALAVAAWIYRRRFPLASYGFFAYLILMAPTSSILPIRDPIAERRLYFGMLGLLFIVADVLMRLKLDRKTLAIACGIVAIVAGTAAHARAYVWADPLALWQDTAQKSPNKPRVRFQLAFAYYEHGRYPEAVREFAGAAQLAPANYDMLVDWALALDLLNEPEAALAKLREAAKMEATSHVYSQIAMVHAKRSQWTEALAALDTAERLDPNFAATHLYRGKIYIATNMPASAVASLQRAVALDPTSADARQELLRAQQMLRAAR